ncbi:MAG: hypothetical protein EGR12_07335 [Coprococcus catus]|nr:hypothetical protein [Coprococcus catus]
MGIFSKIMGTHSERELKRVYPIVDKIEAMGPAMEKLSDEELRAKTDEFKKFAASLLTPTNKSSAANNSNITTNTNTIVPNISFLCCVLIFS